MSRRLRLATPADVPTLEILIARSARGLSAPFYSAEQVESKLRHVFGVDTQLIADATYFVIEVDEAIVACGGWSRRGTLFGGDQMKNGPDPLLDPATEPARIRAFFVDPVHARRGLGTEILAACMSAAAAAGFVRLELVATGAGEQLYRAHGFALVERFEVELPDQVRVPVARMSRELSGQSNLN
jgi:GNAT superfamily N-acetyltransferase